jgi:hypothetical protein
LLFVIEHLMRGPRLLLDATAERTYVVSNEVIAGRKLLGADLDLCAALLGPLATFFGIEVLDYAFTPRSFSLTLRLPVPRPLSDAEYQARHRALYGLWPSRDAPTVEDVEDAINQGGPAAADFRSWMDDRMGQLSLMLKQFKQRISAHGNRLREERGTFWTDRFKSTIAWGPALAWLSSLGPWSSSIHGAAGQPGPDCAYARALKGDLEAQAGICRLMGLATWPPAQAAYAELVDQTGRSLGLGAPGSEPDAPTVGQVAWSLIRFALEATAWGAIPMLVAALTIREPHSFSRFINDWPGPPPLPPEIRMLRGRGWRHRDDLG